MVSTQEKILCALSFFIGLGALVFGPLMMIFPVNTPLGLSELLPAMKNFPFQEIFFQDLFWSGLALLLCNGVCNTISVVQFIRKKPSFIWWTIAASFLLMLWCITEMIFLPNAMAVLYLILAIIQLVLSIRIRIKSNKGA